VLEKSGTEQFEVKQSRFIAEKLLDIVVPPKRPYTFPDPRVTTELRLE